jgi:hypothetical protein
MEIFLYNKEGLQCYASSAKFWQWVPIKHFRICWRMMDEEEMKPLYLSVAVKCLYWLNVSIPKFKTFHVAVWFNQVSESWEFSMSAPPAICLIVQMYLKNV